MCVPGDTQDVTWTRQKYNRKQPYTTKTSRHSENRMLHTHNMWHYTHTCLSTRWTLYVYRLKRSHTPTCDNIYASSKMQKQTADSFRIYTGMEKTLEKSKGMIQRKLRTGWPAREGSDRCVWAAWWVCGHLLHPDLWHVSCKCFHKYLLYKGKLSTSAGMAVTRTLILHEIK